MGQDEEPLAEIVFRVHLDLYENPKVGVFLFCILVLVIETCHKILLLRSLDFNNSCFAVRAVGNHVSGFGISKSNRCVKIPLEQFTCKFFKKISFVLLGLSSGAITSILITLLHIL